MRRHVDELDLVGEVEHPVGHRSPARRTPVTLATTSFRLARCWALTVVTTSIPAANTSMHVFPSLRAPAPRDVRVSELVDQCHLGRAGDQRLDVHLLEVSAAVGDGAGRQAFEALEHLDGRGSPVGMDHADDDVSASLHAPTALTQHRVRLAHAGSSSEVDAERGVLARHRVLEAQRRADDRLGDLPTRQRFHRLRMRVGLGLRHDLTRDGPGRNVPIRCGCGRLRRGGRRWGLWIRRAGSRTRNGGFPLVVVFTVSSRRARAAGARAPATTPRTSPARRDGAREPHRRPWA